MSKVEELRKSLCIRWDGWKAAQGPYESAYRGLPPELEIKNGQCLLDVALAEEFERGRESVRAEVEVYLASECARRKRPTGGFYGGEEYGPEEGEEAYDIIDGVRDVLKGSSK